MTDKPSYADLEKRIATLEKMENAFKRSEKKWQNTLKSIPQIGLTIDLQGNILFVNQHLLNLTGWQEHEVIGGNWFTQFLPKNVRNKVEKYFREQFNLLDLHDISSNENEILTKNGELRNIGWSNLATRDIEGNITDITCLGIDLTERRRAEEQLKKSEKQFRTIFMHNNAVMLLIDRKTQLIVDANPAAISYYGYSQTELVGKKLSAINTLTHEAIDREMRRACDRKCNYFIFKHTLANGEVRDVEVFSSPIESDGRKLLHSIVHDITERRRLERKLQISNYVIASSPDLISLIDRKYVYRKVNTAFLEAFQAESTDIVGRHVKDIVGEEIFLNMTFPNCVRAFKGETVKNESWIEIPVLGRRYLSVTYHPVTDGSGSINYVSLASRDMTKLKRSEQKLASTTKRLEVASRSVKIGVWDWNVKTNALHWNNMMFNLYHIDPNTFSGLFQAWQNRVHPDDLQGTLQEIEAVLEGERNFDFEFRILLPDQRIRHIRAGAILEHDEDGTPHRLVGANWDVTEQRELESRLRDLATVDSLTQALNRHSFVEIANKEIGRAQRHNLPFTLLLLDIDLFKKINDNYGHTAGDEVLKRLTILCKSILRSEDSFCRIGGEEFAATLVQTKLREAKIIAERLREEAENCKIIIDGVTIQFTVSIGLYTLRPNAPDLNHAMKLTDRALYRAKSKGRNRVETCVEPDS